MSIDILQYNTTVDIPWGKLQYIVEWCTDHCQNDWNFSIVEAGTPGKYSFNFKDERDYLTFLLVVK